MLELTALLNNLHDAVLEDIKFDWENGKTVLSFKLHEPDIEQLRRIKISCNEVVLLEINRRFEWGKSVHVNEVVKENRHSIKIEMQSGDIIQIHANNFDFEIQDIDIT